MNRHAMSRQDIPSVVIQQGRNKVHLDIRTVIGGMFADNETSRFGNI